MDFMVAWHSWSCSCSWKLEKGNFLHLPAPTDQRSSLRMLLDVPTIPVWAARLQSEQGALETSSLLLQGIERSAREGLELLPWQWLHVPSLIRFLCSDRWAGGAERAEPGSAGAVLMTDTALGTDMAWGTSPALMSPGPCWLLPQDIPEHPAGYQLSSRENQRHQERQLRMCDEIPHFNYQQ